MLIQFDVDVCLEIEGTTANTTQDRWVDSRSTKWINLYKWGGTVPLKIQAFLSVSKPMKNILYIWEKWKKKKI